MSIVIGNKNKLVVFAIPFTPMLKIVKDGCALDNVEFVVLPKPKKIRFFVYHIFRVFGLNWLAMYFFAPTQLKKIMGYRHENVSVLFWSSHAMSTWITIEKLLKPVSKSVFSWAPMDEDSCNRKYFARKIKRIEKCKKNGFSFFTYNSYDAAKYGMKLTTQVYRRHWGEELIPTRCDFYFIGKSKGRDGVLSELKRLLVEKNFSVDFRVFEDQPKEFVPFEENIRLSKGCRCIVDVIAKKVNAGQTLRPLEALFFKKKLLTNDASVKECDFYHPSNIFIFDENNVSLDGIEKFMEEPFHEIDETVVEKYDVNNWLKHYFLNS